MKLLTDLHERFAINDNIAEVLEKLDPLLEEAFEDKNLAWDLTTAFMIQIATLVGNKKLDRDVVVTMLCYMLMQNEDIFIDEDIIKH
jgi:hypothetical protein|tara:strand:- start:745 stop:1005 length:261 start_codon:yes stop_codon:yes gene_type:complete